MLTRQIILEVLRSQAERLGKMDKGLTRNVSGYGNLTSHAYILTGIRRCGKSTMLQQIHDRLGKPSIYLNFEDPRLAGFNLADFNRLQSIAEEEGIETFFFDEIQLIDQWENFVRFRLDEAYSIFISGSNAQVLSKDLGDRLTGRHISKELFPFSYSEYLLFTGQARGPVSSESYLFSGGFPEYLKTGLAEVVMQNFNDIIVRDIALRCNIRNTSVLQQLAVWLVSNCAKTFTGNSLRKLFDIGSSSSIMEYLAYFADAYLFFYIPRFSYSSKVQLVNPKKVYSIDNGMIVNNSLSFSDDKGRLLENLVFLHLRRKTNKIFYFSEKKECDFVTFQQKKLAGLYQVCWQLDQENLDREINGLIEALDFFGTSEGNIITFNQTDAFTIRKKTITATPFWAWASEDEV